MEWPACGVEECERPVEIRKWELCRKHYYRMRKYGDPTYAAYERDNDPERWRRLYEVDPITGCWLWTSRVDPQGYGMFSTGNVTTGAHRHVFEQLVRPLLPGETIDHVCHSRDLTCPGGPDDPHRRCVRPEHLEPVPHAVNAGRVHTRNARKTHCSKGHPFDAENTVEERQGDRVYRLCRICRRENTRERMRRHRAGQSVTAPQTHCKRGHEFTPENTYVIPTTGGRQCRACSRARLRDFKRSRAAGAAVGPVNAAKTHCKNGHEYTPENTRIGPSGARACRACDRGKQRLIRARQRV